jgi:probable HAF family extracellular repeat protein
MSACGGGGGGDSSVAGGESIARVDDASRSARGPVYHVTDLGTLGGTASAAHAVNERGQVTGESALFGNHDVHAFLYAGGTMLDLGTLLRLDSGEVFVQNSYGNAINKWGQVTGSSNVTDKAMQAFVYSHGSMQGLAIPAMYSVGNGINARGQIAGTWSGARDRAFLYSDGIVQELPGLGVRENWANAINDRGQITGGSFLAPPVVPGVEPSRAFLYHKGVVKDLGTLGGTDSNGFAINAKGWVTGISELAGDTTGHAFLHDGHSMRDLGSLGGYYSFGFGVNAAGQVVGSSQTSGYEDSHAFLWSDGTLYDLNNLLDGSGDRWTLITADDINGRGQIVGTGLINCQRHGFLLTPVDRDDHEGPRKDRHDGHWSYSEGRASAGVDSKAVAEGRLNPLCMMDRAELRHPSKCRRH